jgi:hypothetical protein
MMHSFETRTGPAGRTGPSVNRWVSRFGSLIGSVMLLNRCEPVKLGQNRINSATRRSTQTGRLFWTSFFFWTRNSVIIYLFSKKFHFCWERKSNWQHHHKLNYCVCSNHHAMVAAVLLFCFSFIILNSIAKNHYNSHFFLIKH